MDPQVHCLNNNVGYALLNVSNMFELNLSVLYTPVVSYHRNGLAEKCETSSLVATLGKTASNKKSLQLTRSCHFTSMQLCHVNDEMELTMFGYFIHRCKIKQK